MQEEFNGLKTLIMKENECTFYVHRFTHQLQLTLVKTKRQKREGVRIKVERGFIYLFFICFFFRSMKMGL